MRLLSLGPEPSASANSAIRAGFVTIYKKKRSVKEFIIEGTEINFQSIAFRAVMNPN